MARVSLLIREARPVDDLDWKYHDFIRDSRLEGYFLLALAENGRLFFAASNVSSDLAAGLAQVIREENALPVVDAMIFILEKAKDLAKITKGEDN